MRALTAALGDAGAALLFLAGIAALFPFTVDDAFIVMRYARNLVEHGELSFNLGEPVNALTSPLHGLISSALAFGFGVDRLELANKLFSVALVLGSTSFAARALFRSAPERLLFAALGLLSPFMLLWTVGGLETPILSALIVLILVAYVELLRGDEERPSLVSLLHALIGLAVLCRADSIVFLAPMSIHVWLRGRQWRSTRVGIALLILIVATWYGFACLHYGAPLPTSAYVKLLRAPRPLLDNLGYTAEFALFSGGLPLAALIVLSRRSARSQRRPLRLGLAWVGVPLLFLYSASHSAQHMFFGFRFFVPYLPVLAAIVVDALIIDRRSISLSLSALVVTCQGVLVLHMMLQGLSVTWAGVIEHKSSREYDNVPLPQYVDFIAQLKRSAEPIRRHWAEQGLPERPRLALYTAGAPSFVLPEFYVLEQLVSYRHDCQPNLFLEAHYAQFLMIGRRDVELEQHLVRSTLERGAGPVALIHRAPLHFGAGVFALDVAFVARPLPLSLPGRVDEPCPSTGPGDGTPRTRI